MPMQFSDRTFLKMLLRSCNIVASRKIVVDLFAHPSTRINPGFGVAKTPFQVGYCAGVGALFAQVGWIGEVNLAISPSYCLLLVFRKP
jgi:hypothetical protein